MWSWLAHHRYWIAYYAAYLIGMAVLLSLDWPDSLAEAATDFTVAAGIAVGIAAAFEIGVRIVLSIPGTIKKLLRQGLARGLSQGRKDVLDELVRKGS